MGFADYTELQAAVASWLVRNDLTASIVDFITLAEKKLNLELRVRDMVTRATGSLVAATQEIALPADFEGVDLLWLETSPVQVLTEMAASEGRRRFGTIVEQPRFFTVVGSNLVVFPTPGAVADYVLDYFADIPALSDAEPTNWLLVKAPQLYLYGALLEATPFLQDDARITLWESKYEQAKTALHAADRRARVVQGPRSARVA